LVGNMNAGSLSNTYATGDVAGKRNVGGLAGFAANGVSMADSYAEGSVTANNPSGPEINIGGFIGEIQDATLTRSYATGAVDGEYSTGGLAGAVGPAKISDSFATGAVNGTSEIGGLAGNMVDSNANITTSYAVGSVTGSSEVGGLVGSQNGTVTDSYWDTEATGQSTSDGGTGLTTSEMTGSSAETNMVGFDFSSVWGAVAGDYPDLP
jgi:hypothetical protein